MNYKYGIINQDNSYFMPIGQLVNTCQSTVKIIFLNGDTGSGFFIKFPRNNTTFKCLMTNNHVIENNHITNKEKIIISYNNQINNREIILDNRDRIIKCFDNNNLIDITIVEIVPKDKIEEEYFLSPNPQIYNYNNYPSFIQTKIEVIQYPHGGNLSRSKGTLLEIFYNNLFAHDSQTSDGSSGSPIVLKGDNKVIAIHKGKIKGYPKNVGIFIGIVLNIMKDYKRNGEGKDYYPDGKIKYEGKFVNDKYEDDNGIFYFEYGNFYIGQFKNGLFHGIGYIVDKNNILIKSGLFENGILVSENNINNISNNNNIGIIKGIKNVGSYAINNIKYGVKTGLDYLFGDRCEKCKHLKKRHSKVGQIHFACLDCPDNNDLCIF